MYKNALTGLRSIYESIHSGQAQESTKRKMKALGERERARLSRTMQEQEEDVLSSPLGVAAQRFMEVREENERLKEKAKEALGPTKEGIDTRALYTVDEEEYKGPEGMSGFLAIMDKHEGGGEYDTLFKFSNREGGAFEGVDITNMTIGELKEFSDGRYGEWSKGELGYKATPMGRYQFVGDTLEAVAKEMGLSDDTKFTPQVQDAMFEYYLDKRIASAGTLDKQVQAVRSAWEGFKNVPTSTLKSLITDRLKTKRPEPRRLGGRRA